MVGWSHCVAVTLGLVASVQGFVPAAPLGSTATVAGSTPLPHVVVEEDHAAAGGAGGGGVGGCSCPACVAGMATGGHHQHGSRAKRRAAATAMMMARGRRGRGGGWTRRRRQDANPVEFDKYGFPIPPKKSAKELEEEHRKWMESIEPPEGYDAFVPEAEGYTAEDVESHPLADLATAEAAAAAAPTAAQQAAAVAGAEGGEAAMEEHEPDWDNIPEWGGEMLGMDDPLDAPWRRKGEEVIAAAVAEQGFEACDITWHLHHVNVDVVPEGGQEAGSLSSDEIVAVTRAIEEALLPHEPQLRILQRFHMSIGTPGAKDVLTTAREFEAFKGFEVHVLVKSPVNESEIQPVRVGRLVSRDPVNLTINVKGKNVKIPTGLVAEVRLPEAMREEDDFEVLDDAWETLFTNGKVPSTIECEYAMPGIATLGKGVVMVEPEMYEPPPSEEDDEDMDGDLDDLDDLEDDDDAGFGMDDDE